MLICENCGGTGQKSDRTPCECGIIKIAHNRMTIIDSKPNSVIDSYKDNFSSMILQSNHTSLRTDSQFTKYTNSMHNLITDLSKMKLPESSAIFYAPRGYGKRTFAESYIKEAKRLGFSVIQLLDITDVINICKGHLNRDDAKNYYKLSEYDIFSADVLIVSISSAVDIRLYSEYIVYLTSKRSYNKRSTLFMSRITKTSIIQYDKFNSLDGALGTLNECKNIYYIPYVKAKTVNSEV